ncbi:hypothetical protein ARMGADRAFT_1018841 [Armillaria gallica]|uniref:Uncharacterized protein n=1 Tax=Armillaria gallica TaxID=47427 RepID=A0A2H3CLL1_ARMGA|nr:hypothetical protein ARMGADRAFT_1018841 [Armillaria gallica]
MSKEGGNSQSNFCLIPEAMAVEAKVLLDSGSLVAASQRRGDEWIMLVVDVVACGEIGGCEGCRIRDIEIRSSIEM